ncbi:hypothetical protein FRC03_000374 [Tulasnella sp. 419]|nr:hypothetical protein FRC03_000374 [Tulasnella sp. 419]
MVEFTLPAYADLSTVDLPAYTAVHASTERVLLQQPLAHRGMPAEYQYKTKRMALRLGRRLYGTSMPCYGKNAVIEGSVTVKTFKNVKEVSVTIIGKVTTNLIERGFPVVHDTRVVLFEHKILWSETPGEAPPSTPTEFPISFPLPTYARGRNTALPPTATMITPCMEGDVRYSIKIDMCRKGLRRHECTMTPILYLPRSVPTSVRSVNTTFEEVEEKALESPEIQWRTTEVQPSEEAPASRPFVEFSLPLPLSYPSQMHIPFMINILTSDEIDPDVVLSNLSVTFLKRMTISVNGYRTQSDKLLGVATVWKMEKIGEGLWSICGSVGGGREAGEMSWCLPGSIDVKYCVQLIMKPSERGIRLTHKHIEVVQMTTHEELTLDDARELPALGLIGVRCRDT